MIDYSALLQFSQSHCVAICAALVPLNLLGAIWVLILVALERSPQLTNRVAASFSLLALLLILHVASWFVVGVVMLPTFVLLWLGTTCLGIYGWAIGHPASQRHLLIKLGQWLRRKALRTESA